MHLKVSECWGKQWPISVTLPVRDLKLIQQMNAVGYSVRKKLLLTFHMYELVDEEAPKPVSHRQSIQLLLLLTRRRFVQKVGEDIQSLL